MDALLSAVRWNAEGLVPVVAQEATTRAVLMLAWMNERALKETFTRGEAVYWSRSRQRLWHKGEESGHTQKIREIRLDCDGDALLLLVEQGGNIACHTGSQSCFYRAAISGEWRRVEPVLKDPAVIYHHQLEG